MGWRSVKPSGSNSDARSAADDEGKPTDDVGKQHRGFPLSIILQSQLHYYCKRIALGATFQQYVAVRPAFWAFFPLSLAMLCLVIGISRDGWLLVKRRGTPTLLPWPYRLAMLFAVIAVVRYVLNSRIP